MNFVKGSKIYVRIDYRIEGKEFTNKDLQEHFAYVGQVSKERHFIGGGFSNKDGGMCLFEAAIPDCDNNYHCDEEIIAGFGDDFRWQNGKLLRMSV